MAVISEQINNWPTLLFWLFCKSSFFFNINMWKRLCCHTCICEAFLKTEKLNPICNLKIYFPFIFVLWDNWNMYWAELWKTRTSYFCHLKRLWGSLSAGQPYGALWDTVGLCAQCCSGSRYIQHSYCLQPSHSWWLVRKKTVGFTRAVRSLGSELLYTSSKIACCGCVGTWSS